MDGLQIPARVLDGDFAGWLRDAMNERGMSPRLLGLQAGVHPRAVVQILYGGRQPSTATALALLRFFAAETPRPQRPIPPGPELPLT